MKDLKRRVARIRNLMTRQRHDVRFRDEMLISSGDGREVYRTPR